MAEGFIIEIRNHRRELVERRRISGLPFHIGRSYSNDLIIDDGFVCPTHLRITNGAGGLTAQDMQSLNGLFESGTADRTLSISLRHGTQITIGQTTLVFIDPQQPVAPAIPIPENEEAALPFRPRAWHAGALVFFTLLLSTLQEYWFEYSAERSPFLKVLVYSLIAAIVVWLPWAGIWALVGHIVRKRALFSGHIIAIALGSYLLGLLWLGAEYAEFAFGSPRLGTVLMFSLFSIWAFALLQLHLRFATSLPLKSIRRICGAVVAVLLGLSVLYDQSDALDFSDELPLETNIKPPTFKLARSLPVDAFVKKAAALEDELRSSIKD